jgi:hypothetical protein
MWQPILDNLPLRNTPRGGVSIISWFDYEGGHVGPPLHIVGYPHPRTSHRFRRGHPTWRPTLDNQHLRNTPRGGVSIISWFDYLGGHVGQPLHIVG